MPTRSPSPTTVPVGAVPAAPRTMLAPPPRKTFDCSKSVQGTGVVPLGPAQNSP